MSVKTRRRFDASDIEDEHSDNDESDEEHMEMDEMMEDTQTEDVLLQDDELQTEMDDLDADDNNAEEVAMEVAIEVVSSPALPKIPEKKAPKAVIYEGQMRLSKGDDPHWLSDAHCFIRKELVEAFSAREEDIGPGGASEIGQVGFRCVYCAEQEPPGHRPKGHVYFPSSVTSIQQVVSDLQRRHVLLCSQIPDGVRETFTSLIGFGSKTEGDTSQYWIDSARELGLTGAHEGNGMRFFRNPLDRSPADVLDVERTHNKQTGSFLVRAEDRSECTDHIVLLLKQFRPCRFQTSDRRGGPGSTGRDRALNFPGLGCIHCSTKNNFGRYFPLAAKNLGDSTSNLMMNHVSSRCLYAPLAVKASLAYLHHRSLLQKAELSGVWKKRFFKRVWERLHHMHWDDDNGDGSGDCNDDGNVRCSNEHENYNENEDNSENEHETGIEIDNGIGDEIETLAPVIDKDIIIEDEAQPVVSSESPVLIIETPPTESTSIISGDPHPEEIKVTELMDTSTLDTSGEDHERLAVVEDTAEEEEESDAPDALAEMEDLIKAAAIWLCEQDEENSRTRAARTRSFPQSGRLSGRGGRSGNSPKGRGGRGRGKGSRGVSVEG